MNIFFNKIYLANAYDYYKCIHGNHVKNEHRMINREMLKPYQLLKNLWNYVAWKIMTITYSHTMFNCIINNFFSKQPSTCCILTNIFVIRRCIFETKKYIVYLGSWFTTFCEQMNLTESCQTNHHQITCAASDVHPVNFFFSGISRL